MIQQLVLAGVSSSVYAFEQNDSKRAFSTGKSGALVYHAAQQDGAPFFTAYTLQKVTLPWGVALAVS